MKTNRTIMIALALTLAMAQGVLADISLTAISRDLQVRVEDSEGWVTGSNLYHTELGTFSEDVAISALFDAAAAQESSVALDGDNLFIEGDLSIRIARDEAGEWAEAAARSGLVVVVVPVVESVLEVTYSGTGTDDYAPRFEVFDQAAGVAVIDLGEAGGHVESINLIPGHQYFIDLGCSILLQGNGLDGALDCAASVNLTVTPGSVATEATTYSRLKSLFE